MDIVANNPHIYPEGCYFSSLSDIKNKHITVMGLGLNGGGEAIVKFFLMYGAYVIATDMKTEKELQSTIDSINNDTKINKAKLTYRLGEHRIEDFENADCVIKNPGVKYEGNKYLAAAKVIETDISIFLSLTRSPIIAVTGSKGKSSTASAIKYGLSQAGLLVFLGGNITISPLLFLTRTNETTPVVLELSSWQLADLRGRKLLKPRISIITKIVQDHQNWYGNMNSYIADKRLIYADQNKKSCTIFDYDNEDNNTPLPVGEKSWGDFFAKESKATIFRYSKRALPSDVCGVWQDITSDGKPCGKIRLHKDKEPITILKNISVPGSHMRENVLNAALVMALSGINLVNISKILATWKGIPHRLQYFYIYKKDNIKLNFYNDSCATVPEATVAAIKSFNTPITLIAGGTDKELEQNILANELIKNIQSKHIKDMYLLKGSATEKLINLIDGRIKLRAPFNSLEELLLTLFKNINTRASASDNQINEIIVFSPGATSFGMFSNEFDRGDKFMSITRKIFNN